MAWQLHRFPDNPALVLALAPAIGRLLANAVGQRGRATLAVSGGSTPHTLFEALSHLDLPWGSVTITLVDERWVDEDDAASNARLVRNTLLQNRAAAARFVGLKTATDDPFAAVAAVHRRLHEDVLGVDQTLDIAILGMGEDGHVASFLPGARGLHAALMHSPPHHCSAIGSQPGTLPRMTLTLDTLLQSRHLLLHFIGQTKYAVLQRALAEGPVEELPVRSVLQQNRRTLEIYYAER